MQTEEQMSIDSDKHEQYLHYNFYKMRERTNGEKTNNCENSSNKAESMFMNVIIKNENLPMEVVRVRLKQ